MAKKILVLGSCRVVNTIAFELVNNILVNEKDLWFTHYLQEHIQKIKHLFGEVSIPYEHKELFVRYEQQDHYASHSELRVAESLKKGPVTLNNNECGVLNVVVEIPTIRYIEIPINGRSFWGHSTNLDLIRNSLFNQIGGYSKDEHFLELLTEFEQIVLKKVSSSKIAEAVNFVYVPHNPFIELNQGSWGLSDQRVHIFDLIRTHCEKNILVTGLPMTRHSLDVKSMIQGNGGVEFMLDDQNHYSHQGRKIVSKYLEQLTR